MDWGPPVLLVDDLSVLLSLGVKAGAVLDFSHYCRTTICTKLQVCRETLLKMFQTINDAMLCVKASKRVLSNQQKSRQRVFWSNVY